MVELPGALWLNVKVEAYDAPIVFTVKSLRCEVESDGQQVLRVGIEIRSPYHVTIRGSVGNLVNVIRRELRRLWQDAFSWFRWRP